ncbi:MAG: NUDIX domain-containing protein [Candidatus Woesearchaeota archaeon]
MARICPTSGGVVVRQDKVILVSENGVYWCFPTGHNEPDETDSDAAEREIFEQTGISQLELIKDLGIYERFKMNNLGKDDYNELKKIRMFLFRTEQEELYPLDPQIAEVRWVDKGEVSGQLKHAKDKEFFLRIIEQI